jgi:hypothetical protein
MMNTDLMRRLDGCSLPRREGPVHSGLLACFLLVALSCFAQEAPFPAPDTHCPKYPEALRSRWSAALEQERIYRGFTKRGGRLSVTIPAATIAIPRANFIDTLLFDKMAADGINPAPVTTDSEFLRRASLDLTGRIPQPEKVIAFLNDTAPDKRAKLIEQLLASDAYVSQFTLYFNNRFLVTRGYPSNVRLVGRNLYYSFLRDFVARDRPYNEFVQELLSAAGDADTVPGVNYYVRYVSQEEGNPPQDFWDDMTDYVTTQFLGFRTACISCHNGRGHLENINLFLAPKKRSDFWNNSAFFARTDFFLQGEQDGGRFRYLLQDRSYGSYTGAVPLSNPGNRPQRMGANVTSPAFILTGDSPSTSNWRSDFIKLVTADRQFARATVNYLWAYFFGTGIVDPPDGWDLSRIDANNPPPDPWPVQNSQPALLEALTDAFIKSNYSIKSILRLIVNSSVYQLTSRYPAGQWSAAYASDFARHSPRRLSAEELWDAITTATQTEEPMNVAGFPNPVMYANELPDPYEPWDNGNVTAFLSSLGRGNHTTVDRDSSPTLLGLLFLMNQWDVYQRTAEATGPYTPVNRATRVAVMPVTDDEAVRQIFLATLARYPTTAEISAALAARGSNPRIIWLPRLQWALVNKLDFIFDN